MTRINVVPPKELSRQHLIAEYRELPRVFGLVKASQGKGHTPETLHDKIPPQYTLGKGHVLFFFNKLAWLEKRYNALVREMICRGYNVRYSYPPTAGIRKEWFGDYRATRTALYINRQRIKERTKPNDP